jgi:hypothetical protein
MCYPRLYESFSHSTSNDFSFFLTQNFQGGIGKGNHFRMIAQARSSGGERYPDTVEVVGSNPIVPTIKIKGLWPMP